MGEAKAARTNKFYIMRAARSGSYGQKRAYSTGTSRESPKEHYFYKEIPFNHLRNAGLQEAALEKACRCRGVNLVIPRSMKTTHQQVLLGSALKHAVLSKGQVVLERPDCQLLQSRVSGQTVLALVIISHQHELQLQALKQQRRLLTIRGKKSLILAFNTSFY